LVPPNAVGSVPLVPALALPPLGTPLLPPNEILDVPELPDSEFSDPASLLLVPPPAGVELSWAVAQANSAHWASVVISVSDRR
jgi:hypothetical protein